MPANLWFALALAAPLALPQSGSASLSAEQRSLNLQSLEKVWNTVREKHWDPTLGGVNWTAAREAALRKLRTAGNMEQARAAMSEMLAKLGQSHFAIIPSDLYKDIQPESLNRPHDASAGADSATRQEQCGVGIGAAVIDGKARVVAIEDGSPAARAGVRIGWELLSVDEFDIARTMTRLAATDLREREVFEQELIDDAFLGPRDKTAAVVLSDGNDQIHKIVLDRAAPRGNLATLGFLPKTRVWMEARQLDGRIGYVRFNLFLDPEHLMPEFEKAVRQCLKCDGFVIDIRGNPGGIGAMSMGMAGWFVSRRGRMLGTLKARNYTSTFEINPRADTFDRPLAILVDGGSASTSEIFAAGLQDLGRARVFGTKTAGAALPSVVIRLPNSDGFQYAEATYSSRNGQVLEGTGVTPDVIVKHSRESLLNGQDAVLDAAVEWIKSRKQGAP